MRNFNRNNNELRKIIIEPNIVKFADASCKISYGDTQVICTATVDRNIPKWLRNSSKGWITSEYSMLPRATNTRTSREAKLGKQSGRTMEIQRLIGRSLRSIVDLTKLKDIQIIIDCDVIQADGGTRTASITGGYLVMHNAIMNLLNKKVIKKNPIKNQVCAISCGIIKNSILLDLDYSEDTLADVDANFVFSQNENIIEIQISGEENTFNKSQLDDMYNLAKEGAKKIFNFQSKYLK